MPTFTFESDALENSFDWYCDFVDALSDSAQAYGIAVVIALEDRDPLKEETTFSMTWNGGVSRCLGMAERARLRIRQVAVE